MKSKALFASFVMIFSASFVSCSKKSLPAYDEQGLYYELQDDNTYAVSAGKAYGLFNIAIPRTFNERLVTTIADNGFKGNNAKTITIPNSVTSIGSSAFRDCTSLTSIIIPDGVEYIEWETFKGCTSLTSIAIPNSVTSIVDYAFSGCTSLTSISIPNSQFLSLIVSLTFLLMLLKAAYPLNITNLTTVII